MTTTVLRRCSLLLTILSLLLPTLPAPCDESFTDQAQVTEALYGLGSGARDGVFNSLSASMLGWGIGLTTGIAVLAAALHPSTSGHNDHSD